MSTSSSRPRALCVLALAAASACLPTDDTRLSESSAALSRSANPPGGIAAAQAPQFVAVTFDDNFSAEGMTWATDFLALLRNPNGSGNAATFDGTPVRTSFYHNSLYLQGNEGPWGVAVQAGHETGDHTVNHPNGLSFDAERWQPEVQNCRSALKNGLGLGNAQVAGFRAPYLGYNDPLYDVLAQSPPFAYDTSIQSCWADAEHGGNCPWPYTLDSGSADAATVVTKFGSSAARPVGNHAGLWEMPVAALIVPPDSAAAAYGFPTGLRDRVRAALTGVGAPSFYEPTTGKIAGLDITLIVDARMTRAEATATLKYSLDRHLEGNRSPFIFIAHTHVYASSYGAAVNVPSVTDRRGILDDFIRYALARPAVRMRPVADILTWMKTPVALGGTCTPSCTGRTCGDNGCGGSCGACAGGQICNAGTCQSTCTPSCTGRVCGDNGCGGSCGSCAGGQTCTGAGQCSGGGTGCSAPAWAPVSYAVGDEVTQACTSSVVGTTCYGKVGTRFAWRCGDAYWCKQKPGSEDGGWWVAWTATATCP